MKHTCEYEEYSGARVEGEKQRVVHRGGKDVNIT